MQHVIYCDRQAALIHVERVWVEDAATAAGRQLHERAHLPGADNRRGVRVERDVPLVSERLGLIGRADTVEYHPDPAVPRGVRPFPVEFKRGSIKKLLADRVQLCAQAMCLEEMHGIAIPGGALYYGASHRRVAVTFDEPLRRATEAAAARFHELVARREVPRRGREPRCRTCSLEPVCMPDVTADGGRAGRHLAALLRAEDAGP